jgi:Undecaprenyl-phosphate glucose phosphotransferase
VNNTTTCSGPQRGLRPRKSLSRHVTSGVLALLEGTIIALVALALVIVYIAPKDTQFLSDYTALIIAYTVIYWQGLHLGGLYNLNRYIVLRSNIINLLAYIWLAFFILLGLGFALKVSSHFSRIWAFSWMIGISLLIPVFRIAASRFIRKSALSGMLTKDIAIYGAGENSARLVGFIQSMRQPWLRIIGVFDDRTDRVPEQCGDLLVRGGTDALIRFTRMQGCDEILLAMPHASRERYLALTDKLQSLPVNLRIVPDLSIKFARNLPGFGGGFCGIPTIDLLRKPVSGWGAVAKRAMDVLVTGLFCLFALPVIGLIALLIKLDSRGPVFFRQERYGFQNGIIEVFKFRSMYVDCADADAEKLTTRDDPRVTRAGAWLRRFSLDELPQLFNVLKSDMSLVGPRPHALKAKAGGRLYQDVMQNYGHRIKVKPGLTGWAQVNGWRGNTETEEQLRKRVEHDLYYIENWSIMLDVKILLRTLLVVVQGKNSY